MDENCSFAPTCSWLFFGSWDIARYFRLNPFRRSRAPSDPLKQSGHTPDVLYCIRIHSLTTEKIEEGRKYAK